MIGVHRFKLLGGVVLLGILLAGCSDIPDKSAADMINQGVDEVVAAGEKVSSKALELSDKVGNKAMEWTDKVKENGLHKELSVTQAAGSGRVLRLENTVGNIEVKAASGDQIIVNAVIRSENSLSRKAERQEILDHAEVSVIPRGDQLDIVTHPIGNTKQDLWEWAKNEYNLSDFSIDYSVELPASVSSFDISSDVGGIHLSDLEGTYLVHNQVGSIQIEGAGITGDSSVESEAGKLQLGIHHMDEKSSLKAVTNVGSIQAVLAGTLSCSLVTDSEVGRITGAAKGKSDINGGGPLLSLTSSVGSISIEQPEVQ